jgi:polysaccharide pyruvyl transferase WcaK-like protein
MNIGVWGFYSAQNFGDDLMAIAVGEFLLRYGTVTVFELRPQTAQKYGFKSENEIDSFVSSSNLIVLGGGNLLSDKSEFPNSQFWENKIQKLLGALKKYGKPVVAISIGGNGQTNSSNILENVRAFLHYERLLAVSVRLPSDLILLQECDVKNIVYCPDILFSCLWGASENKFEIQNKRCRIIGLHLPSCDFSKWLFLWISLLISLIKPLYKSSIIIFNGFPRSSGDFLPDGYESGPRVINCEDPVAFLQELSRCEIVVSHKLHVGVVAAIHGAKFISTSAHPKVLAQLNLIGLSGNVVKYKINTNTGRKNIIKSLILAIRLIGKIISAKCMEKNQRTTLQAKARGHFEILERCILNLAN